MNTVRSILICLLSISVIISGCENDEPAIVKEDITGQVQKGPFINGTTIYMSKLNPNLEHTGNVFSTQIIENTGLFEVSDVELTSNFVELSANGFYFNEVEGQISAAQLNLYALADINRSSTINVNILTHLEKRRVEYLVENGMSFLNAKSQAQQEILSFFGMTKENIGNSENLDISVNNDDNAILLAISIILQGNRSVGDLTELIAAITTDLHEDGVVDDASILTGLRTSTLMLSLSDIRKNLVNRYNELGIETTIPDFEKYVNDFLVFTAMEPVGTVLRAVDVTTSSAKLEGVVNPQSSTTTVVFEYGPTTAYGYASLAAENPFSGNENKSVTTNIAGLDYGTTYHYRQKMSNEIGITYSADETFKTDGIITDIEGNTYKTRIYGDDEWMLENLKTTKFNDGTDIPYLGSFE